MTDSTSITVPRPHVPYGPEGMDPDRADAAYLREAAHRIRRGYLMGSNLTDTVTKLLTDAATAIEAVTAETPIDEDALTAAHLAVEDVLIELRDGGIAVLGPANGFVVRDRDATPSPIMRLGTRDGLRIGIEAYLRAVAGTATPDRPRVGPGGVIRSGAIFIASGGDDEDEAPDPT